MVAVVLLPGMDGTGELFSPFVEALGQQVEAHVVRYPSACVRYSELEQFVRAHLPDDKPYLLLGESFSGPIAISIAASRPKGLVGLILCCTFARCPVPHMARLSGAASVLPVQWVPQWIITKVLLGRFSTEKLRAAFVAVLSQVPPSTLRERVRSVLSVDVSPELSTVAVPVVYLQGSCDRVVPEAASRHIASALPSVKVVSMEGPHFLLQSKPVEAAAVVRSFMQEVAPSSNPSIERTAAGKPAAAAHVER